MTKEQMAWFLQGRKVPPSEMCSETEPQKVVFCGDFAPSSLCFSSTFPKLVIGYCELGIAPQSL